jgi:hypothetical protein
MRRRIRMDAKYREVQMGSHAAQVPPAPVQARVERGKKDKRLKKMQITPCELDVVPPLADKTQAGCWFLDRTTLGNREFR